jgi:2-polyprenyl-3-methyl-5-hydroxy-6-metoxy-1,4-benzoquinol methylase
MEIEAPDIARSHSAPAWTPSLGGERVVEGIHYGWLMRDHIARYHFAAKYCQRKRVLDVATGTGYGAHILRTRGANEVVAVDREQEALAYASSRYGSDGLRWVDSDAYALPFDSEFDIVVSFETIEHLKEPERFVRECRRVVKPGGTFLVSTPLNVGGPYVSDYHELEFTRREFEALLGRYFSTVHLFGQRRELRTPVRLLGEWPDRYWRSHIQHGRGNHRLFTWMDRLNKAPNAALAWMWGLGDSFRAQIREIDEPLRGSSLLCPNYYVMLAVCRAH